LNEPCRSSHQRKEDSHGNEEEEKEEDAEVREGAGLVLGLRKTLRFCGVAIPPSG
jgi:hypothetical protein